MKVQIDRHHMRLLCSVITSILFVLATPASRADITFAEPEFYAECTPSHYPTRARLFDMDGDGKKDLLLPGRDILNILNWCTLNSDGSAGPMQTVAVDGQVDDAIAADIDGDGTDELTLVIRSYAGRLQVMRRAASGLMVSSAIIQLDREPRSITKGDFDGDGDIDFAVSCYGSEHIAILLNGGTGNFTVAQRIRADGWSGGISGPQDVLAGDLNADGRTDLVVGWIGTRRFDIFFGQVGGTFRPPVSWLAPDFTNITQPAVVTFDIGDVDGDGDIDILAPLLSTGAGQPVVIFRNDGAGGFANAVKAGEISGGYHWGALLADFDGDGDLDAVTSTVLGGNILVWRNDSTAAGVAFAAPVSLGYSSFARHFLAVNIDGDCDLDLIEADIAGNYALGYRNLRDCGGSAFTATNQRRVKSELAVTAAGYTLGDSPACVIARQLAGFGADPGALPAAASLVPPPACGPSGGGGRCDEVHANPGCFTTPCCDAVCIIAPDCCIVTWEQVCVDLASTECNGLVCPSYGPCNEVHPDPGCEDPDCCARVTPLDGYCDGATWDWVCVARAAALCGLPPCTITVPTGARLNDEACYLHTNDGPTRSGAVSQLLAGQTVAGSCTTGSPRDTDWYTLGGGTGSRVIRLTLDAEFPAELHLMRGPMNGPLETHSIWFGGRCAPMVQNITVTGGPWYAVVSLGMDVGPIRSGQPCTDPDPANPPPPDEPPVLPGFDGTNYWIRHECPSCAPNADLNHDGVVNGADLGILLGEFGLQHPHIGDLNFDGQVNGADLGLLLGLWSQAEPL